MDGRKYTEKPSRCFFSQFILTFWPLLLLIVHAINATGSDSLQVRDALSLGPRTARLSIEHLEHPRERSRLAYL